MKSNIKNPPRAKLTESQKRANKEARRKMKVREQLQSQYSIKGFHRIFTYECENSEELKIAEIKAADLKIAELLKQL